MNFKGDFYARKAETRRRIHNWLLHKSAGDPVPSWKQFRGKLSDEIGSANKWISEKLLEQGLKEVDGNLKDVVGGSDE